MPHCYLIALLVLAALFSSSPAQEITPTPKKGGAGGPSVPATVLVPVPAQPLIWLRFENSDKNFAVDLPSNYWPMQTNTTFPLGSDDATICYGLQNFSSQVDGTVMVVEVYFINKKTEEALKHISKVDAGDNASQQQAVNNGIKGLEFSRNASGINYKRQYFPLDNGVLMAMTISRNADSSLSNHFWKSLRVGKALAKEGVLAAPPEDAKALADIKLVWDANSVVTAKEATTKAVILWKPIPYYTIQARKNGVTGAVAVRLLLGADGQVRQVIPPFIGLADRLTEMAIAAAKRIKFFPATYNGKPVSQWVTVQYDFKLY